MANEERTTADRFREELSKATKADFKKLWQVKKNARRKAARTGK